MESPFPNSTEEIVASALLHLSSSASNERITGKCEIDHAESLLLSKSFSRSSASSTVSSDDVSSDEAHGRGLHMVATAVAYSDHEMKLKVVRKSRSKTLWISDCRKISNVAQKINVFASCSSSETTEVSSCLSGGSSSLVSSSESCKSKTMKEKPLAQDVKKKPSPAVSSTHLLRRSEAILKVLAHNGSASEVRIRQLLGDSPDTSKALRM
ncbi:uncharacterized protein LOC112505110 [Cynara cardunculus var. scolymus]|uniref:uncharacterized protein LOC112505110 n=1 Tax=Cynara cardunculus var. scolymus TaxID=59895 RepID=UPI000D62C40F|nr:uncharacterized protein LOC112505110 [Cynara cardunculus var. scolymus]